MTKFDKLDNKGLFFIKQPWTTSEKKLFGDFLNCHKSNRDLWNDLTPAQQQEILNATEEIKRGEITDYQTFIARHRS